MKTYILRNSETVDARKRTVSVLWPTPAPAAVWHLFKYWEAFNPEVFRKAEEKMQRKKLARLHNTAAALGLKLVPAQ